MIGIPSVRTFKLADPNLQRWANDILSAVSALQGLPIAQGTLATVTLSASLNAGQPFQLSHNLGRPLTGLLPSVPPASAFQTKGSGGVFVQSGTATSNPSTSVNLYCTAALAKGAVLSFWAF